MENQRGLTIVLWVVVLFGIFFLARGLTGKAVLDLTTSDQCNSSSTCISDKICCYGFCNTPEMCSQINNTTTEVPKMQISYLSDIGFGLLVLLAVLIAFYGVHRRSGKGEGGMTRKVSRVSKKRGKRKKRR